MAPYIDYVATLLDMSSRHRQADMAVAAGRENRCGEATNCQTRRIVRPPTLPRIDCCEEAGSTMIGQAEADRGPTTACSA